MQRMVIDGDQNCPAIFHWLDSTVSAATQLTNTKTSHRVQAQLSCRSPAKVHTGCRWGTLGHARRRLHHACLL